LSARTNVIRPCLKQRYFISNHQEIAMSYVDGFVLPVPKKNLAAYKKMATLASKVWKDHGALDYHECVADDVKPGKYTSFPQSVKLKKNEVVVFAYIIYKSRKDRDRINKLAMNDKSFANFNPNNMPFDGKRMFWGGFKTLVSYPKK
jgi:uncharacterized protein YbaA (DUF1428 family)